MEFKLACGHTKTIMPWESFFNMVNTPCWECKLNLAPCPLVNECGGPFPTCPCKD